MKTQRASLVGQIEVAEKGRNVRVGELTDEPIEKFAQGIRQRLRDGDLALRRVWLRHFVAEVVVERRRIRLRVRPDAVAACSTAVPSFDREWRSKSRNFGHICH